MRINQPNLAFRQSSDDYSRSVRQLTGLWHQREHEPTLCLHQSAVDEKRYWPIINFSTQGKGNDWIVFSAGVAVVTAVVGGPIIIKLHDTPIPMPSTGGRVTLCPTLTWSTSFSTFIFAALPRSSTKFKYFPPSLPDGVQFHLSTSRTQHPNSGSSASFFG